MEKTIRIQIHDYDTVGRYRIVEERMVTRDEVVSLKRDARKSVKVDWDKLPTEARHIVYYGELLDKNGNVCFAAIYKHGEAFDDSTFYRIFAKEGIGYVGAIHKR